jgi:hypothetical protein
MNEESAEVNRGDEVGALNEPNMPGDESDLWHLEAGSVDAESEGCGGGDGGGDGDGSGGSGASGADTSASGTSDNSNTGDTSDTSDTEVASSTQGTTSPGSAIL